MNLGMLNPIANTGMETTAAYEMVAPQMEFITDSQSESLFYTASAIIMLASICWMTWIYILVFTHTQHGTYSIFSNFLDYTIYHERDWWNNKPWNKYPKGAILNEKSRLAAIYGFSSIQIKFETNSKCPCRLGTN